MELQEDSITEQDTQPQEPTLKEKTAKGLFWGGISNGIQQLLGVVIGILLLKNLTPDDYGIVGLLAIFTGVANAIQESGFTIALTNRINIKDEDYNSVFWFNLISGCLIYLLLFFSAPLIADFYDQKELIPLSRILFLSIVISSLGISHNAVLFRNLMVKEKAKIEISSISISGVISIYLAINGFGYWALAIQTLVNATIGTCLRWFFSPWRPIFKINFKPVREMFGFSAKILFSSIIAQIQGNIFSVLIGKFYIVSDVGYFSQGLKWGGILSQILNNMINNIGQPVFNQTKNNTERVVVVFRKLLRFIALTAFPLLLGFAFVGEDFVLIINDNWLPCVPVLVFFCISGIVVPINVLYTQIIFSYARSDLYFWGTLISAILQIGIAFLTLPFGIYWMAFTLSISVYIYSFVLFLFIRKIIPISIKDILKDILPYLLCTLFVLFIVEFITLNITNIYIRFILKIILSILLYIGIIYFSNSVILRESVLFIKNKKI
jgi:O-antigen/teichoic acid export membrane protein